MKWLGVVLVLLGLAGYHPASNATACPQTATTCKMGCCAEVQMSCCPAGGQSQNAPQAPTNSRDLQVLLSPAPARVALLLPVANGRVAAQRIALSVMSPPADRLAALCTFLI